MSKGKHITVKCLEAYEKNGVQGVYDKIKTFTKAEKDTINTEHCKACDSDVPSWIHECLICSQETTRIN